MGSGMRRYSDFSLPLSTGFRTVHFAIRDASGNLKRGASGLVLVMPTGILLSIFVALISAGALRSIFHWAQAILAVLCARTLFGMSIANEIFSKDASRVSMLMSCRFFRRLLFLRYRSNFLKKYVKLHGKMRSGKGDDLTGIMSLDAVNVGLDSCKGFDSCFLDVLVRDRCLEIAVASGTPRAICLRSLAMHLCYPSLGRVFRCALIRVLARFRLVRGRCSGWEIQHFVPVFVDVNPYLEKDHEDAGAEDLIRAILDQFADLGDINHPKLAINLLDHGDFLFIFDGVDLADPRQLNAIRQFSGRFERENCMILSGLENSAREAFWKFEASSGGLTLALKKAPVEHSESTPESTPRRP